ncbi:MAG: twin-arginine translocase TatA/TatE family subunit [Dehalococcoidia bacterium]|nr:twin-arginine translocase TatA/TatE family subunit [Dehalococcoidia bacterium]
MPNLGVPELLIILVVIIVIFGVGKLPEIGGALGRGIKEFRSASKDGEAVQMNSQAQPAPKPENTDQKSG